MDNDGDDENILEEYFAAEMAADEWEEPVNNVIQPQLPQLIAQQLPQEELQEMLEIGFPQINEEVEVQEVVSMQPHFPALNDWVQQIFPQQEPGFPPLEDHIEPQQQVLPQLELDLNQNVDPIVPMPMDLIPDLGLEVPDNQDEEPLELPDIDFANELNNEFNIMMNQMRERLEEDSDDDEIDDDEERKERIRNLKGVKIDENEIKKILDTGLRQHKEDEQLIRIKNIMSGKRAPEMTVEERSLETAHIEVLNNDELNLLFKRFNFRGKFLLSKVCPNWRQLIDNLLSNQTYLWFNRYQENARRFLSIEDCCEKCHFEMNKEPVIQVIDDSLIRLFRSVLIQTPNLKCLRLYRFSFNKSKIGQTLFNSCQHLVHLDLTECKGLTTFVATNLGENYVNLKHLILASTGIEDNVLKSFLFKMKKLETICVNGTRITGNCLQFLPITIKRLDIRCCPDLVEEKLQRFPSSHISVNLIHLKIDATNNERFLLDVSLYFRDLILFEMSEPQKTARISTLNWTSISRLSNLQSLKIGGNVVINGPQFQSLVNGILSSMKSFSIELRDYYNFENKVKEEDLILIQQKWPLLERLEIMNSSVIKKMTIESLQQLSNLSFLNLSGSSKLEDQHMEQFLRLSPETRFLVLDNCSLLSKNTLDSAILRARRMTCETFYLSMIRSNLSNIPYMKAKLLPTNLRVTFSSICSKTYTTFDGIRSKKGKIADIFEFMNGK